MYKRQVLEGGEDAPHRIQGIGANFIPSLYDASVVEEIIPVPDDEAIRGAVSYTHLDVYKRQGVRAWVLRSMS